jgi:CheY-like chemotaxis protein
MDERGAKGRVLVIDDDSFVRQIICEVARNCDFEVLEAAGGDEGIALIRARGVPDLVVTDIVMPGKDGFDTIRDIRAEFPDARICAMSGGGRSEAEDYLARARHAGADAVLSKPMKIGDLEDLFRRFAP